jgi:aldehyde dehydrogenase (NAD+)
MTSVSSLRFAELVAEVLPPGVLNIVSGTGEDVGDPLVRHRDVRKVTMTGSTQTGRAIQRAAADTLTPSIFELGGKSPNIVFADADLDAAAQGVTVESVFTGNAGQVCVAGSRIVLGDPADDTTTMGPLVSREQYDRVVGYLKSGAREAELVFGGRHGPELVPGLPGGHWVEPTLFTTTDNSLRICQAPIDGGWGSLLR